MWLPPALLLLCLPGCLSLTGPSLVSGTTGDSLSVQCRYDSGYRKHNKYWCRKQQDDCDMIVETKGTEREERNGRVSIRDRSDEHTFTVTMQNLKLADAGSYWCKIQTAWIFDAWSRDPSVQVQVSVSPAPSTTTRRTTRPATTAIFSTVNISTNHLLSHCPGVPLSITHFLFLIFLKLPLLLSTLVAALCVSRCQRGRGERQGQPALKPPPCSVWSPGAQPFRLDKAAPPPLPCRAGKQ